jgi:hypothetical protein
MGSELAGEQWDERAGLAALRRDPASAWKLARTKPTTAARASALLSYIATEPASGLFDLGEMAGTEPHSAPSLRR